VTRLCVYGTSSPSVRLAMAFIVITLHYVLPQVQCPWKRGSAGLDLDESQLLLIVTLATNVNRSLNLLLDASVSIYLT
jgi:hypothetical protein